MNIFFLDFNPKTCAQYHCDKHVNKMIVEHLQMMSTALGYHGLDPAKKKDGNYYSVKSHPNHPCTKWVKESFANFLWLYNMTKELCSEFELRYGKKHAGVASLLSINLVEVFASRKYPNYGHTAPALAMPDFCKKENPVESYRNYYNLTKWKFANWKDGNTPYWWAPACSIDNKEEYSD